MKENTKIETLMVMFIIAMGDWNGTQWEYYPKLPNCFTESIGVCNGNFLRLTVNNLYKVECWFVDKNDYPYCYPLETIKKHCPILFASIVTHVYDMIENVNKI